MLHLFKNRYFLFNTITMLIFTLKNLATTILSSPRENVPTELRRQLTTEIAYRSILGRNDTVITHFLFKSRVFTSGSISFSLIICS